MIFNGSDRIRDNDGDYIVLTDNGCEGFSVHHQAKTLQDALRVITRGGFGSPQTLVKLVRVEIEDEQGNPVPAQNLTSHASGRCNKHNKSV